MRKLIEELHRKHPERFEHLIGRLIGMELSQLRPAHAEELRSARSITLCGTYLPFRLKPVRRGFHPLEKLHRRLSEFVIGGIVRRNEYNEGRIACEQNARCGHQDEKEVSLVRFPRCHLIFADGTVLRAPSSESAAKQEKRKSKEDRGDIVTQQGWRGRGGRKQNKSQCGKRSLPAGYVETVFGEFHMQAQSEVTK